MVEIRAPFLLPPIVLTLIGTVAVHQGRFDAVPLLLFTAVVVLWHVSVNTLNEYCDDKLGIDLNTTRTMFSGGSGTL